VRVLLAFDKFKDSLTAPAACAHAARALRELHPDWSLDLCPLADGGEGFAEILTHATGTTLTTAPIAGPRDAASVKAHFGLIPAGRIPVAARALLALPALPDDAPIAVVELAQASGLALLAPQQRDPWHTTTLGTGQLIRLAAEHYGARAIVLGVGGSATHDLGLGALAALGLNFFSADGEPLHPPLPRYWEKLARLSGTIAPSLPPIRIACDVTNTLLGPQGAATIYGPQKGLRPADLRRFEHASARLALMLCAHVRQPDTLMDAPGSGAAGGIAFGLMAAARAQLLSGSALVAAWLGLEARLAAADLVLTGEGRFDASSLAGKGPGAIVARARELGKRIHVFTGATDAPSENVHVITPAGTAHSSALRDAAANLTQAVRTTLA
jgi:glycerate kinase